MALQTNYSETMSNGAVGAPVNMENWNGITRVANGGIGFGQPVVRVGDKNCALLSAETLEATSANGTPAPAGATITASPAVSVGAKEGQYTVTCITAGATGRWRVEDPDGVYVGVATTGSEFSAGGLTFTITDTGTDPAVGEAFVITVVASSGTNVADILGIAMRDVSRNPANNDAFVQYENVPIWTQGPIWVMAGASIVAGDDVYWNPSTGRYTKSTGHIRIPGFKFDSSGGNGDLVVIAKR